MSLAKSCVWAKALLLDPFIYLDHDLKVVAINLQLVRLSWALASFL
jgi:hypothetical protein